jgi:hypothetical protein
MPEFETIYVLRCYRALYTVVCVVWLSVFCALTLGDGWSDGVLVLAVFTYIVFVRSERREGNG